MLRGLLARLGDRLMALGAWLMVRHEPAEAWPLDEHTDSCLRCRGQLVTSRGWMRLMLHRAAGGESLDHLDSILGKEIDSQLEKGGWPSTGRAA